MDELLALVHDGPRRTLEPGDVLLVDGEPVGALYVLLEGALRVEKGGAAIAMVAERGACVGEMSLLLGIPATADVVASERSVLAVIEDAPARLDDEGSLTLTLARLLATRLQVMTTYLADLKHQYADHEGGLGHGRCGARQPDAHHGHSHPAGVGARSGARVLGAAAQASRSERSSTPSYDDHRATPSVVSSSTNVGTGPGCRPALHTVVAPMRSIQLPSATNGDWCT